MSQVKIYLLFSILWTMATSAYATPALVLTDGWQYRWGDSPFDSAGVPIWLNSLATDSAWQRVEIPGQTPGRNNPRYLWQRVLLPAYLDSTASTLFLSGCDQIFEVYLADQKLYAFGQPESDFSGDDPGYACHLIDLPPHSGGKMLTFRSYSRHTKIGVNGQVSLGSAMDHILTVARADLDHFVTSSLFLVLGVFIGVLSFVRPGRQGYWAFGLFSICVGIWTLSETLFGRILVPLPRFWLFGNLISLYMIPIGLLLFVEHFFGSGYKKMIRWFWMGHALFVVGAVLLEISGALPMRALLRFYQYVLIGEMPVLVAHVIYSMACGDKAARIFAVGFIVLMGAGLYDVIGYMGFITQGRPLSHWGVLFFIIALGIILDRKYTEAYHRLELLNQAFGRFVPHEMLRFLNKRDIMEVQLGDNVALDMTILFSDIRGFTGLSEQMTPEDNFRFINAYLSRMEPNIKIYNGFVDKYIGDAIMGLFPKDTDEAVAAALAMIRSLTAYNQTRGRPGRPQLEIGIGLNSGRLMLGTIGGQNRMDGTVISDAVNLASRIEGMTKQYGATLLISEFTRQRMKQPEIYDMRLIGRVQVKGKTQSVTIYEVFNGDAEIVAALKKQTLGDFQCAMELYQQADFVRAEAVFADILVRNPEDGAAHYYAERCQIYRQQKVGPDWAGVEILTSK